MFPRNLIDDDTTGRNAKTALDVLSAFIYFVHFGFVWIYCIGLYLYYRKRTARNYEPINQPWTFFWCFGILNFLAVVTQISWPTAPPWYPEVYGNQPASYKMAGYAAGLSRADRMIGYPFFGHIYETSPIVFGSFPSLHAAWPLMITLFAPTRVLKAIGSIYVLWVWWAAVYLNHHFFVDVLGGALYVLFAYFVGKATVRLMKRWFGHRMYSTGMAPYNKVLRNDIELGFWDNEIDLENLPLTVQQPREEIVALEKLTNKLRSSFSSPSIPPFFTSTPPGVSKPIIV
jgi:hypothetical protein